MVRTKAKTTKETKKTTRKKAAAAPKKKTIPTQNVLKLIKNDSALSVFADAINGRYQYAVDKEKELTNKGKQTLSDFASGYLYFGLHRTQEGWVFREWAPNAYQLYLTGEFNGWKWLEHPMTRLENGVWELVLDGKETLWDGCKVKTIVDANLTRTEHIPLYIRRVEQDKNTYAWCGVIVDEAEYKWKKKKFWQSLTGWPRRNRG